MMLTIKSVQNNLNILRMHIIIELVNESSINKKKLLSSYSLFFEK